MVGRLEVAAAFVAAVGRGRGGAIMAMTVSEQYDHLFDAYEVAREYDRPASDEIPNTTPRDADRQPASNEEREQSADKNSLHLCEILAALFG
jgi:hypothetical protein